MPRLTPKRLQLVLDTITLAERKAGRPAGSVKLLAVSKKQGVDKIRAAFEAGQSTFAENYVQEALEKQKQLGDLAIEWHFIGNIQSNKAKLIARHFDWVQSINSISIATLLSKHRPSSLPPLNICIEVNIDHEPSKSGINPAEVKPLVSAIMQLPQLKLRGLMVIPKQTISPENQRTAFQTATTLYETLIQEGFTLDTLSMGMSGDLVSAIQAGSTMVRIGTAIFGPRHPS